MATKPLLADLVKLYQAHAPEVQIHVESVGGVDAAKRVQAGEAFDGVVLASDGEVLERTALRDEAFGEMIEARGREPANIWPPSLCANCIRT